MLNQTRRTSVLADMDAFNALHKVDLVGCGVTGSRIGMDLVKSGIPIRVWDDDIVGAENLRSQLYGTDDIGRHKVDAFVRTMRQQSDTNIEICRKRVESYDHLRSVVFLAVDTMAARKEIWERCILMSPSVDLLVDTRLGKDYGHILCLNPHDENHIDGWDEEWFPDEEADDRVCGEKSSVGPTAGILAGYAIWMFAKWFNAKQLGSEMPPFKLSFGLSPIEVYARP